MTQPTTDILEGRLKRAEKKYSDGLKEFDAVLNNAGATHTDCLRQLQKLKLMLEKLVVAYEPVITAYEAVTGSATVDQKLEDVEALQQQHEEQYIDAEFAVKEKFPPPAAVAAVNNYTVQQVAAPPPLQPPPPQQYHARLQEIKIPEFNGDRTSYPRFKSMFDSNIDSRTDLPDVSKLTYYMGLLKGEPLRRVQSYQITPDNYKVVRDIIEGEYGKKELIIDCHLKKLFSLMALPPASSDAGFQSFYIETSNQARALTALGHNEDNIKSTMMTLLPDRMPSDMKLEWFRKTNGKELKDINLKELYDFIELENSVRTRFKASTGLDSQVSKPPDREHHKQKGKATVAALHASSKPFPPDSVLPCMFCTSKAHRSGQCSKTIEERKSQFAKQMRCYRCAKKGHAAKTCTRTCAHCWEPHHVYICQKMSEATAAKAPAATSGGGGKKKKADALTVCSNDSKLTNLVLQTFWVVAKGPRGVQKCRVLLDGGAHLSYINQQSAEALGLIAKGVERQNVGVFGGDVQEKIMQKMEITLKTKTNSITINVLQLPTICDPVPAITLGNWRDRLQREKLTVAQGVEREEGKQWDGKVDILIGVQDYYTVVTGRSFSLSPRLQAVETVFGWVVHGKLEDIDKPIDRHAVLVAIQGEEERVDNMLQRLFDLDVAHPLDRAGISEEKDLALVHFQENMKQLSDGQYELRLPLKANRPHLPTNRHIAEKQVRDMLKRWKKNDDGLASKYHQALTTYIQDGQVEEVPPEEINEEHCHYLTHHAVIKPEKHTKIRPVFNASLGKPSLNDCLHTGKNRVPLMTSILTRLRLHKIVITGDYRKAFLQVSIAKEDRNLQRFLWWEDPLVEEPKLKHLRWKVMVFGFTCSPFQLEGVLTYHVSKYAEQYPHTVKMMLRNTFVDDVIGGAERREKAEEFIDQANEIATAARMTIQRWQTNDPQLQRKLDKMSSPLVTTAGGVTENQKSNNIFSLFESSLKILGSVWEREEDVFTFENSALEDYCDSLRHRTCLRTVLSISARVYDVLGLISPVTIVARILMQSIWQKKLHWDQELPTEMKRRFWEWADELKHVTSVKVPRHFFKGSHRPCRSQLHVYCDASTKAYGAVAYLRTENEVGEVTVALVGSKTRVAPLKDHSVARLELMGAVLAVKLAKSTLEALEGEIELETFYWTDSMVALYWIYGEWYQWKTWVSNRCRLIQEASEKISWRHISGRENPADLCSRGIAASKLIEEDCIWWSGPKMLYQPQENWTSAPLDSSVTTRPDVSIEVKPITTTTALAAHQHTTSPTIFNVSRYGTLETVLRMTARIQRSLSNAILTRLGKATRVGELTSVELQLAKNYWFRQLQVLAHPEEIKDLKKGKPISSSSPIRIFRPYLDLEDGLIKIDSRTKLSGNHKMSPDVPILPSKIKGIKGVPHFIKLLIRHVHRSVCHSGARTTLAELGKQCWIVHARQTVLQILRKCVDCNKYQRKAYRQPTAYLPAPRCTFSAPFDVTGLDLLGPLYTREHRHLKKKDNQKPANSKEAGSRPKGARGRPPGKKNPSASEEILPTTTEADPIVNKPVAETTGEPEEFKVWGLLFTCSTTRAVHLEVAMRIDTPEIIMAVDRFIARRGTPSIIYSDNGTQLVRANKDIQALWKIAVDGILQYAAIKGILWKFIVEKAPWWGGFYERMIGTFKQLLWKCIGRARLTVKELETLFCKIEATINSRPITYQYLTPGEPSPLTPNDLLIIGQRATLLPAKFPTESLPPDSTRLDLTERVKYRDLTFQHWKQRWETEYLKDLSRRYNKLHKVQKIAVGEVVLVEAENHRRRDWKPAVIQQTFPSSDGIVRSVELRTLTGDSHVYLRRPVQRLYAFELNENRPLSDSESESSNSDSEERAQGENSDPHIEEPPAEISGPTVEPEAEVVVAELPNVVPREETSRIIRQPNDVVSHSHPSSVPAIPVVREAQPNSHQGSVELRGLRRGTRIRVPPKRDSDFIYEEE